MMFRPIPALSVIARVPLKPVRCAVQAYASDDITAAVRHAFEDPAARAALFVASPSLYDALIPPLDAGANVPRRALLRALRYVVRMSTRCTPFGLFAAVAAVQPGETTTLRVIEDSRTSRTRVDMTIFERLVSEIEMDRDTRGDLLVYTNDFIKRRGPAAVVYRNAPDGAVMQSQVIERTALIDAVETIAQNGVFIAALLTVLQSRLEIDADLANAAVDILLSSGIVISSVRSSLARLDDRALLERYAAGSPSRASAVAALTERVAYVNGVPVASQRSEHYRAIRDVASTSFDRPEHAFQTDSKVTVSGTLGAQVLDDAAFMAELLVRSRRPHSMAEAARRFVTMYEGDVLAPLIDLEGSPVLHDLLALLRRGGAHGYTDQGNASLLARVVEAVASNAEVRLGRDEILSFFAECSAEELPDAVEAGFHVCARDADALNRGNYMLVPAAYAGSDGVGKAIGRFLDMMPDIREELTAWHQARSDSDAKVRAELVFVPPRARAGNVRSSACILPYDIQIGPHDTSSSAVRLALSDLYVGVREERFFLWSESLQREVDPYRHDNLTAAGTGSDIIAFLALIRTDGRRSCSKFSLGDADRLPRLPRVRVDRIVLVPARWHLMRGIEDVAALRAWRELNAVPRFVWAGGHTDQKMFVDLESLAAQEQVCHMAAGTRRDPVIIEEALGIEDDWLTGTDGAYAAEFVAALESAAAAVGRKAALRRRYFDRVAALMAPDDGWLFFKAYCDPALQNYVLRTIVRDLLADIRARASLGAWFFVRYADPYPHLRIRFRIADGNERERCAATIWERLSAAAKSGLLHDVSQSPYRREMERYGGHDGVVYAEHLFALDSDLVMEQLALGEEQPTIFRSSVEQAYRVIAGLLPGAALQRWLQDAASRTKKMSKEDREHVRAINLRIADPSCRLGQRVASAMAQIGERNVAAAELDRFASAVLHMHFNRYGISGPDEERALSLVRRLCAGVAARELVT